MPNETSGQLLEREAADDGRLRGSLGVGSIVFMVVAAAAPLTVIAGTVPIGISLGNGAGYPAMYVVCSVILLLFSVGFTNMSRYITKSGGFYTYIGYGLGRGPGLGAAFLAVLSYTAVLVAVYGYIGAAVNDVVTSHGGSSMPWWVWSFAVLAIVSVLGYRQIDLSSKVLGVLLVAEVGVVVILDVFVVGRGGGPAGFSGAALDLGTVASGAPGIAVMFAIAGFLGFEATVIFRDEARDPARTVPRATYTSLVLIGAFYAISSWAIVSAWGDSGSVREAGANPGGMVVATARDFVGGMLGDIVATLLVSSLAAAVLSFHNVIARYLHSLGNTAVLPSSCGRSHQRHGSPHVGSVIASVIAGLLILAAVVAGLDPVSQVFAWLAGIATVGVVALMVITCLAVLVFFRKTGVDSRLWPTVVAPSLGFVALSVCLYLTVSNMPLLVGGSTTLAVIFGSILVAALVAGPVVARVRPHANPIDTKAHLAPTQ